MSTAARPPMTAPTGMRVVQSLYGPRETADRFAEGARARGMTIFARIDHGAAAEAVGLKLRPTELLIFGNARAGTTLMQAAQTAGIDLPLKVLVWQDEEGTTWLGYNDPDWVAARHGAGTDTEAVRRAMADALAATASGATGDVASGGR